jgi:hypothetical protein
MAMGGMSTDGTSKGQQSEAEGKGPQKNQFVVSVSFESLSIFGTINVM